MGLFDEFREPREETAPPALAEESAECVDPQTEIVDPQLEREPAECEPCWGCSCGIAYPLKWVGPFGEYHCLFCEWPDSMSQVRRVVALVPIHLPADYLVTPKQGWEFDQVERTDWLEWLGREKRREHERKRAATMEAENDGY